MRMNRKSDIKLFKEKCKSMIGDLYQFESERDFDNGLVLGEVSFRNHNGKSVYGMMLIRVDDGFIGNVTPLECSINKKYMELQSERMKVKLDTVLSKYL